MVISCLTIYVVAFSSVILLGRSYSNTTPVSVDITTRQNFRKGSKIKTSSLVDDQLQLTQTQHKILEKPNVFQSSFAPAKESKVSNESHSYFTLFDPINNVTKKLQVLENNPPSSIRQVDFYRFSANAKKTNSSYAQENIKGTIKNFIEWDTLRDSEKEVRVHYNGITAKETLVQTEVDKETGKRQGLKLRQLTDGTHFVQLIYNFNNEIQDCEYIKDKAVIQKFLKTFRNNVENAKKVYETSTKDEDWLEDDYLEEDEGEIEKYSLNDEELYEEDLFAKKEYRNITFQIIRSDENLPKELSKWMNYSRLKRKCRDNHKILKQLAFDKKHGNEVAKKLAEEHIERVKRNLDFSVIFPGTKWCGKSHIAEKYTSLGGFSKTDKCCRTHDHCHPLIPAFEEKYGFYNFRPFTISHCRCDLRRKRDLMDVLLVPGTKWCGKGRRATKYTSLGGFSRTDKCCRVHDTMCPYWIGSLEEKYGLFNWRINTIMHCRCDKRFRACLKMAKTGTANFVGKLFFNVVQTKCFVLKPQEVCLKYSWWGKCEKKEYRKKAYLKDNLSY